MVKISIGLGGDAMIGRLVNVFLDNAPPEAIWGDLLPHLKSTDLNLINLEAALTKSENLIPKVFNFKCDPEKVTALKSGRIDVVNIANNHILDYGIEGLYETIETLDRAGIYHVGAGRTIGEAKAPVIVARKGIRIGILGCTDNEPLWEAKPQRAGTCYATVGNPKALEKDIRELKSKTDLVILSIHWGPNMQERPSPSFISYAHHLADLGVDIIHGHSAHIFQGIEIYKNKLILYDTGDLIDDYAVDPFLRNDRSFFFIVEVEKKRIQSVRLIPTVISDFQVNQAKGIDADESLARMKYLSEEFKTKLQDKNLLILQ